MRKTKTIKFRLTEEQYSLFVEKAKTYPSVTALIIDSVTSFDNRGGANKIIALNTWAKEFGEFKADLVRIGNNINQLTHYANLLKKQELANDELLSSFSCALVEYNELFKRMTLLQEKFTRNVINI